jgi:hypothetical protein
MEGVCLFFLEGLEKDQEGFFFFFFFARLRFEPGTPEYMGRDSVVGITTRYRLGGPGIESR